MSLVAVNDENLGVDPSSNCVSSVTCDILCLPQQPTGRPSILRLSQKENMPPKSLMKDVKVCFQTPMRDPVTRKIVSSASKLESNFALDDCTKALEKLSLKSNQDKTANTSAHIENKKNQDSECKADANGINTTNEEVPCPEELPVQSKGTYTIDFDHLDSINPFKSGGGQMGISTPKVGNSPVKVSKTPEQKKSPVKVTSPENITRGEFSLEDTLPVTPRLDNSIPEIEPQKLVETTNDTCSPVSVKTDASSTELSCDVPGEDAETVVSKASYNLDLDNLDKINPFSSSSMVNNSPPPAIGSYNLDIDVDSIDPFKCGGSKLQNSPIGGGSKPPIERSSLMKDVPEKLECNKLLEASDYPLKKDERVNLEYSRPMTETSPPVKDEPVKGTSKPPTETSSPVKDQPMKLEFNFDDGKAKKKPPKNLGKRPPGTKLSAKKPVAPTEIREPPKSQELQDKPADDNIPLPKACYNFDFDMFDDPNFNPFGTDAKIKSSPKPEANATSGAPAEEKAEAASPVSELPKLELHEKPVKDESSAVPTSAKVPTLTENATPAAKEVVPEPPSSIPAIEEDKLALDNGNLTMEMPMMRKSVAESFMDCTASNPGIAADESFRPGTDFLASGFNEPVDYLEQFGTSTFKESALRKQSLYLKFDPLLKESPKKSLPTMCNGIPLPCSVLSRFEVWDLPAGVENKVQSEQKPKEVNILETSPVAGTAPLVPVVPSAINSLVPDFSLPAGNAEDAIIEVLKYSQKDMDAAIEEVGREVQEKQKVIDEWQEKYKKLRTDYVIMETIVAEFESTIAQIVDDGQKQKEAAIAEIQKVNEEKQQVLLDLSSMEKSFSDLFKRFDKQKEVIEGYRKNEETLKRCAQEYLARIKKEEQRYQTLKAHAEEKISLANEEIAQVRTKSKAENAALQATLRREQMKIQSLDRSLEQKAKENEELTKLCDELIMNVQKGGARQ
ncbi:transforming acidic coiled-coil-containing protein 3-like [Acipenser oxyrinchus oxyrinchus]|uniref:Transforming acidic coiled-coil-containing protein 3-like n=1 Tax=Acipenser oxyrinchus oxyrinchus TaxID=40147 RepID=A0AAD8LV25_ACIOX|nr:transforming acidic coiled-coil-containing protein 3-like [Acipenser oxyrinchus oxyrinchus]